MSLKSTIKGSSAKQSMKMEKAVIAGRGLGKPADPKTKKTIAGKKNSPKGGTNPWARKPIGSMKLNPSISRGMQKIANKTKPAQKTQKYTPKSLGRRPYSTVAKHNL